FPPALAALCRRETDHRDTQIELWRATNPAARTHDRVRGEAPGADACAPRRAGGTQDDARSGDRVSALAAGPRGTLRNGPAHRQPDLERLGRGGHDRERTEARGGAPAGRPSRGGRTWADAARSRNRE